MKVEIRGVVRLCCFVTGIFFPRCGFNQSNPASATVEHSKTKGMVSPADRTNCNFLEVDAGFISDGN